MRKSWPTIELGEVIDHRKEFIEIDDFAEYKRCRVQLHAQGIVLRDVVQGVEIKTKQQQVCRSGEFLVAEIDAKLGGYGIVPEALDGAIVSSHYFLYIIDQSKLDRDFLGYFIRTPYFFDQVSAKGSTNYAAIRPHHVLKYTMPLPPLDEQRRIVAHIKELAAKIEQARELRRQAMEEVEMLWQSTLTQVFDTSKSSVSLEEACESIVDNLHSTPRYDGNEFPCLRSQDIGWGTINYGTALRTSEEEFLLRTSRGEPGRGDIVFVREGDVGRCGVVDGSTRFSLGQRVMMFRPDSKRVNSKFLMFQLTSPPVLQDQILNKMTGTTSKHVNIKELKKVRLMIPSLSEQYHIVAYLDELQAKVEAVKAHQAATAGRLEGLLGAMLERAFGGGGTTTNLENNEGEEEAVK